MFPLFAATILFLTTLLALRGGLVGTGRVLTFAGFDTSAVLMGVAAVAVSVYFYGPEFGLALIVTVVVHEFGHVAAFRICGHSDARFRLIPLFGGVAISNQAPASQEKDFFISLMGPAICLAPMALAFALSDVVEDRSFEAANFLYILGLVMGSLNFFNLLPFYPLDGGKIVRVLTQTYAPWATRNASIAMTLGAAGIALYLQAYFLLIFVLMGWQGLMQSERLIQVQRPMSHARGLLALLCYAFTMAAFFVGGKDLLAGFL
jgi:Zn-dependent protease